MEPQRPLPPWWSWRFQGLLWQHCFRSADRHNAAATSAALCYKTIFALIPALVIVFLVLRATGAVEESKRTLHKLMEQAGLTQITIRPGEAQPETGPEAAAATGRAFNVAEEIEKQVINVERKLTFARLGPVGLLLLIWSAVSLLTTIERSLNRIFEAPRARPVVIRVLLYWSAMTFVPIVLSAAGYLAAKALAAAGAGGKGGLGLGTAGVAADLLGNVLLGILLLACIYKFLPNTRVGLRAALVGAAVVVPLWLLARWGFALYVGRVAGKSLYGALGLLPLFLLWMNLCWYVFLMGAELAHTSTNLRRLVERELYEKVLVGPMEALAAAVAIGDSFAQGRGPTRFRAIADRLGLPDEAVHLLIGRLAGAGMICPVAGEADAYVPARPLESIRLADVLALGEAGAEPDAAALRSADARGADRLQVVRHRTGQALGEMSLADLLRDSGPS